MSSQRSGSPAARGDLSSSTAAAEGTVAAAEGTVAGEEGAVAGLRAAGSAASSSSGGAEPSPAPDSTGVEQDTTRRVRRQAPRAMTRINALLYSPWHLGVEDLEEVEWSSAGWVDRRRGGLPTL
jgi:hypothetical protein